MKLGLGESVTWVDGVGVSLLVVGCCNWKINENYIGDVYNLSLKVSEYMIELRLIHNLVSL